MPDINITIEIACLLIFLVSLCTIIQNEKNIYVPRYIYIYIYIDGGTILNTHNMCIC